MNEEEIIEHRESLAKQIVDIAFKIHKTLGPGLLESVYETCFCYELTKRETPFVTQRNKRLGFIINFAVPLLKNGIKRMIL